MLIESRKSFLFIGNLNMATMKNIFPLIRDSLMWTGYTHPKQFILPEGGIKKFGNTLWWTNLIVNKQVNLNPDNHFDATRYPMYDNYPAWNVDKLADIPVDNEIEVILDEDRYNAFKNTYGEDCELNSIADNKYRVTIHSPSWGVPVTFVEHFVPHTAIPILDYNKNLIGGGETNNTSADCLSVINYINGHQCDLMAQPRERERERETRYCRMLIRNSRS